MFAPPPQYSDSSQLTLIGLVLDRSGSMAGREADVVGGVNSFIEEQKKVPGVAYLSMVRFDHEYDEFRAANLLSFVQPLARHEYAPRGSTALLDAVGRAVSSLDAATLRYAAQRVIVVVVTDGQENSSREFTRARVQALIRDREARGWTFVYLGAHADAFAEAESFGFAAQNTARYVNTKAGTRAAYATVSASVTGLRAHSAKDAGLGRDLGEGEGK